MVQPISTTPPAATAPRIAGLSDAAPTERMMLVAVGGHRFGLPIEAVREIVPARPYTPLPGSGSHVAGLVNLRGRIVTVIDLGARLGLAPAATLPMHSVVIVEHAGTLLGLAVKGIHRILDVDREALGEPAEALRALGIERGYVMGMGEVDEELFVAIEPARILEAILA
jgi:purine-binding chemotaxis protein CheW